MTTDTKPLAYALQGDGFSLTLSGTVHQMNLAVRVRIIHSSGVQVTHMLDRDDVEHSVLPFLLALPGVRLSRALDTFNRLSLDAVTMPASDGTSALSLTEFGPLTVQAHVGERMRNKALHASIAIDQPATEDIVAWLAQWHRFATT